MGMDRMYVSADWVCQCGQSTNHLHPNNLIEMCIFFSKNKNRQNELYFRSTCICNPGPTFPCLQERSCNDTLIFKVTHPGSVKLICHAWVAIKRHLYWQDDPHPLSNSVCSAVDEKARGNECRG